MAKDNNLKDFVTDIANAIRAKKGTTDLINPQNFSAEISLLAIGGSPKFAELVEGTIKSVESKDLADVTTIREGVFANLEITTVEIPSNVTEIGASAFANNNISSLTLNEGLQTIGASAFANNPIATLTIPSTIISIGASAFGGTQITELDMSNIHTPPAVDATSFPSTLTTINVAYGDYDAYLTSWSAYSDKIVRLPAIPSTITVTVNNYLGDLVGGAEVTITGNEQTYVGITDTSGVFVQGDLQPATYTISVADLDGFKTPDVSEVVVEEDTQNSVVITYLEKPALSEIFGDNDWITISQVADEISANNMTAQQVKDTYGWDLGDVKSETLSTGEVIELQIIGINHDDKSDGTGKAGLTLQMKNCLATLYSMFGGMSNKGGWGSSSMRNSTIPTIKATLSQELQNVIKLVDKKYANGGGNNYTATNTTSDDLFLLSEYEIKGSAQYAKDGSNEGTQYAYWVNNTSNASRKKYRDKDGDGVSETAVDWAIRSCYWKEEQKIVYVKTDGTFATGYSNVGKGVSFAFCI